MWFFCVFPFLLSRFSRYNHVVTSSVLHFFSQQKKISIVCMHLLFIHSLNDGHFAWVHLWLLWLGCYEHVYTCTCLNACFQLFWIYASEWNCWVIWQFFFLVLLLYLLHLQQFHWVSDLGLRIVYKPSWHFFFFFFCLHWLEVNWHFIKYLILFGL